MSKLSAQVTLDPVDGLTGGERRLWRRLERQVIGEHGTWLVAELKRLKGASVLDVVADGCVVALGVGNRRLVMAEVACTARRELVDAARLPCHLDAGGRYGRFWWIAIAADASDTGSRVVLAGTHLSIIHDRRDRDDRVAPSPCSHLALCR